MFDAPDITIVIPTRNRHELLRRHALAAALHQRAVSVEAIVVDDASDPPVAVFGDPRVRVIRHSDRHGVAVARNTGIAHARGEWVAFLDDDDIWAPTKLETQLGALERGGDFAYAAAVALDAALKVVRGLPAPSTNGLLRDLLKRNVIPAGSSNIVARTALLRDIGCFDHTFPRLDDWDCWLRLAATGRAQSCSQPLVGYVLHRGGRLESEPACPHHELDRFEAKHADLAARLGTRIDRHDFARYVAVADRRAGRRLQAARRYVQSARTHASASDLARAGAALVGVPPRVRRVPAPSWVAAYRDEASLQ